MGMIWIFLFPYFVAACTNTDELITESYLACQTHVACSEAFYLTPAHHFWEENQFKKLVLIVLNNIGIDYSTICANTESFDTWLELLGSWDFCKKNEVYSEKSGDCVCDPSKNCDATMYGTFGGTTLFLWIVLLALTLLFIYAAKHIFSELKRLQEPALIQSKPLLARYPK